MSIGATPLRTITKMLQRKQTLYLLAAIIVSIVCLSLPLAKIEPTGMGEWTVVYALFTQGTEIDGSVWPLFAVMLLTYPVAIGAIVTYKNRLLQARLCVWAVVLCVAWYAYYAYLLFAVFQAAGSYHTTVGVCLPFIAIVLYLLARKGIMDDERLVRSADRIR